MSAQRANDVVHRRVHDFGELLRRKHAPRVDPHRIPSERLDHLDNAIEREQEIALEASKKKRQGAR
ncbi:MAG: hypothetical protein AAGE52_10365, partial [Myxococcota bacterium]